jgi:hypothetical protein
VPAAVGRAWWRWQQRLYQRPQLVRHEVVNEGRHGAGSSQTDPKGAKRRLSVAGPAADPKRSLTVSPVTGWVETPSDAVTVALP